MRARSLSIIASLVLLGGVNGCGSRSLAAHDESTATSAPKAAAPTTPVTPESELPIQIPAGDAAAIWRVIDQKTTELDTTVQSGSLGEVHHIAFAIRDLVAALQSRSTGLAADQQIKVNNDVKFVATIADRLDASGDANDRAATQANFDKLTAVLKDLRTNYGNTDAK